MSAFTKSPFLLCFRAGADSSGMPLKDRQEQEELGTEYFWTVTVLFMSNYSLCLS